MTPSLHPPLLGEWLALNPPGHPPHAHDLVGLDPETGRAATGGLVKYLLGALSAQDVYGWSSDVLAPLDGVVVASHDGEPDRQRLIPLIEAPASFVRPLVHQTSLGRVAGNHLILSTAAGFVLLAHLRRGSLTVGVGDEVSAGQAVGRLGNSGNTMGPHLHLQVMDGPDPMDSIVIPFRIDAFHSLQDGVWKHHEDSPLPDRATRIRLGH